MPFMLKVVMEDGTERLAYLSDRSRETAETHAEHLRSMDGIQRVRVEEFESEADEGAEADA